jgi:fructokinase
LEGDNLSFTSLGAIDAGGTKFLCGVGTADGEILEQIRIPTGEPVDTMERVVSFFRSHRQSLAAIGIASFGPLQLNPASPHYGYITSTPKTSWAYFDLLGAIRKAIAVPLALNTDVNAAALGESRWGAGQQLSNFMYVTVGTGIGGAALINSSILPGLGHVEMGHIRVPHDLIRDPFPGACPYHGDCLEGLASGSAIEARWKISPSEIPADHPAWGLQTEYLALACTNWICTILPERLILGGGAMRRELFPRLRSRVQVLLNGYFDFPQLTQHLEQYLVPPGLGANSGLLGALTLASAISRVS